MIKRGCCILMVLLMMPVLAFAGSIDDFLNLISTEEDDGIEITMQCSVQAVSGFSEKRVAWLNDLLRHLTFRLVVCGTASETEILVDGTTAVSYRKDGVFSFEPDKSYRAADGSDIIEAMSGEEMELSSVTYYTDLYTMMSGFYEYFSGLPEVFPESCSWSKINVQYKGYGTAVHRCAIALPEDAFVSADMTAYINTLTPGPAREMLEQMVWSGRQRYTLLLDENMRPMKINYTGRCGLSSDSIRSVNVDWRCPRGEHGYKDILKLTNPAVSGNDRKNLNLTLEYSEGETEKLTASIETDEVSGNNKRRIACKMEMTSENDTIDCTITERTVISGSADVKTVKLNMDHVHSGYEGTLEIAREMNKIEENHFLIRFAVAPAAAQPAPATETDLIPVPETVLLSENEYPVLAERITAVFLRALIDIPEEDLQFILADLPEGWWTRFRMTTQNDLVQR